MKKRIRPDLEKFLDNNPKYERYGTGYRRSEKGWNVASDMIELAGKELEMEKLVHDALDYEYTCGEWSWVDEWLVQTPDELEGVEL